MARKSIEIESFQHAESDSRGDADRAFITSSITPPTTPGPASSRQP